MVHGRAAAFASVAASVVVVVAGYHHQLRAVELQTQVPAHRFFAVREQPLSELWVPPRAHHHPGPRGARVLVHVLPLDFCAHVCGAQHLRLDEHALQCLGHSPVRPTSLLAVHRRLLHGGAGLVFVYAVVVMVVVVVAVFVSCRCALVAASRGCRSRRCRHRCSCRHFLAVTAPRAFSRRLAAALIVGGREQQPRLVQLHVNGVRCAALVARPELLLHEAHAVQFGRAARYAEGQQLGRRKRAAAPLHHAGLPENVPRRPQVRAQPEGRGAFVVYFHAVARLQAGPACLRGGLGRGGGYPTPLTRGGNSWWWWRGAVRCQRPRLHAQFECECRAGHRQLGFEERKEKT
mmetsp:Transcript_70884/g.139290  ORF Transcript_70884/g.139290 Transcript_70884/m.139290 type:complete len:348 (-) Transcript_70884:166-1209(-)